MKYEDQVLNVAAELADTFEEHAQYYGGVAYVSKTGWELISDRYEKVVPELRASVMNDFMKELTKRGVPFDVKNLQEKPE